PNLRIEHSREVGQLHRAPAMDAPPFDLGSDGFLRLRADRREEVGEQTPPAHGLARAEAVAQEVELDVLVVLASVAVPAVHYPCLFGMRFQPALAQALLDRGSD